jgi:hypothetical protein
MGDRGWEIALRRIEAIYDIQQFVASSLVRKIAASHFRLPAADRHKFQQLTDEAIARIEQIVREAYLEGGEDVGRDIRREHLSQQVVTARRDMVARGELISGAHLRERLGLTERRLAMLLANGSVFTLAVDDMEYYPALLADASVDRERLQEICRIIVPAPPDCRLDFLSSSRGSLGGRSPPQMLDDDDDFKVLRQRAAAWAAEFSRTVVKVYKGEHQAEPKGIAPMYMAVTELDPRRPLWERASEALHAHGYEWPLGPYPEARNFTLFVERNAAGYSTPMAEACVQLHVNGEHIQIRIRAAPGTALHSETVRAGKHNTFIDVAKRVVAHLCKH